jgi:hypothetical protein
MSIKTKCYIRGLEHGSLSRDSQRATLILTAGFLRRPAGAEAGDGNWPWQRQAGGGRKRSNGWRWLALALAVPTRRRHESYTVNMIHDAELHTNHPQALGMIVDWRRHDPVVIHA